MVKKISKKELEELLAEPVVSIGIHKYIGQGIAVLFILMMLGLLIKGLIWSWNFLW